MKAKGSSGPQLEDKESLYLQYQALYNNPNKKTDKNIQKDLERVEKQLLKAKHPLVLVDVASRLVYTSGGNKGVLKEGYLLFSQAADAHSVSGFVGMCTVLNYPACEDKKKKEQILTRMANSLDGGAMEVLGGEKYTCRKSLLSNQSWQTLIPKAAYDALGLGDLYFFKHNDYERAFKQYSIGTDGPNKNAAACTMTGICYLFGYGVEKNLPKAIRLFLEAKNLGFNGVREWLNEAFYLANPPKFCDYMKQVHPVVRQRMKGLLSSKKLMPTFTYLEDERPKTDIQFAEAFDKLNKTTPFSKGSEIERLLKGGVDPNLRMVSGYKPLMYAIHCASIEYVELLLQNGADPNVLDIIPDKDGKLFRGCSRPSCNTTPLMYAANNSDRRLVLLLLQYGADVNYALDFGLDDYSLVTRGYKPQDPSILKLLTDHGFGSAAAPAEHHVVASFAPAAKPAPGATAVSSSPQFVATAATLEEALKRFNGPVNEWGNKLRAMYTEFVKSPAGMQVLHNGFVTAVTQGRLDGCHFLLTLGLKPLSDQYMTAKHREIFYTALKEKKSPTLGLYMNMGFNPFSDAAAFRSILLEGVRKDVSFYKIAKTMTDACLKYPELRDSLAVLSTELLITLCERNHWDASTTPYIEHFISLGADYRKIDIKLIKLLPQDIQDLFQVRIAPVADSKQGNPLKAGSNAKIIAEDIAKRAINKLNPTLFNQLHAKQKLDILRNLVVEVLLAGNVLILFEQSNKDEQIKREQISFAHSLAETLNSIVGKVTFFDPATGSLDSDSIKEELSESISLYRSGVHNTATTIKQDQDAREKYLEDRKKEHDQLAALQSQRNRLERERIDQAKYQHEEQIRAQQEALRTHQAATKRIEQLAEEQKRRDDQLNFTASCISSTINKY